VCFLVPSDVYVCFLFPFDVYVCFLVPSNVYVCFLVPSNVYNPSHIVISAATSDQTSALCLSC